MLAVSFGQAIWLVIITFFFVVYLMMLFSVIVDLFRDRELGGFAKALWAVALIVFPLVTMLAYLIVRGRGMAERSMSEQSEAKASFDSYVREVAGSNAASELATATELRDKGAISDEEYAKLKAKLLG